MSRTRKVLSVLGVAALMTVAAAGSAQAASKSGGAFCQGRYTTGKVYSTTTGSTSHGWLDRDKGDTMTYYWAAGGPHASTGYQNFSYTVAATTVSVASATCV